MNKISNSHFMTKEEEIAAFQEYQSNKSEKTKNFIILNYITWVQKLAHQYSRYYGVDAEELTSEGILGLMRSIDDFDLTKGFRFSTYAIFWIKSYLRQYIFASKSIVRRSRQTFQGIHQCGQACQECMKSFQKAFQQDISVDQKLGDSESDESVLDRMADDRANFEDDILQKETTNHKKIAFYKALDQLKPKEKEVLKNRYLTNQEKKETYEQLGKRMGLSQEGVRQIEKRALKKLKDQLKNCID